MNKGVLVVLMAGVGLGVAIGKMLMQKEAAEPTTTPAAVPVVGHRLADRLIGYLEVERN